MLRASTFLSVLALFFGTAVFLGGCAKPADKATPKATPKEPPAAEHKDHSGHEAHGEKPTALSAEDRALIEKQKTCPVTGEPLGSMGEPVKVVVKGQTVFLCCAGCEDAIKKDADKYLAKLKK